MMQEKKAKELGQKYKTPCHGIGDCEFEAYKAALEMAKWKDDEFKKLCDSGEASDGFHTFNELYDQREVLFAVLVNTYKDLAWKSYRHEDGELCFGGGWFIVGIDTPEGSYTYHYKNEFWDDFKCKELERGKHWDGHTAKDVRRLMSLVSCKNTPKFRIGCTLASSYLTSGEGEHVFGKVTDIMFDEESEEWEYKMDDGEVYPESNLNYARTYIKQTN